MAVATDAAITDLHAVGLPVAGYCLVRLRRSVRALPVGCGTWAVAGLYPSERLDEPWASSPVVPRVVVVAVVTAAWWNPSEVDCHSDSQTGAPLGDVVTYYRPVGYLPSADGVWETASHHAVAAAAV